MGEESTSRRDRGVTGAAFLITVGAVLLLHNLELLPWGVWGTLLRLWPVLLISVGLDILLAHRSAFGALVSLLLTLSVVAGILWLGVSGRLPGQFPVAEEISEPLGGATMAEVVISPGVGSLHLDVLPEASSRLIVGTVRSGQAWDLTIDSAMNGETARFSLEGGGDVAVGNWFGEQTWDLQLNGEVPIDLTIDVGAGELDLDLMDLTAERLRVDLGVGEATVELPAEGRYTARIEGAIGQTTVIVPEGLEARIEVDAGLSGRSVPAGYVCEDDVCTSPGYANADHRVDLTVSQAIGNLVIRQR
jgi:hypothetical protein